MIDSEMSVAENIVLGQEPSVGPMRQIYSRRRAECICDNVLNSLGQASVIRANQRAGTLSTGAQTNSGVSRAL